MLFQCASLTYLNSIIAVIRHVNVATFVHTHSCWVPDLAVGFTPRAKLIQKVATVVKNLTEKLVSLVDDVDEKKKKKKRTSLSKLHDTTFTVVFQPPMFTVQKSIQYNKGFVETFTVNLVPRVSHTAPPPPSSHGHYIRL